MIGSSASVLEKLEDLNVTIVTSNSYSYIKIKRHVNEVDNIKWINVFNKNLIKSVW